MDANPKRATVYFEPGIHRALRLKATETDRPVPGLFNEAMQLSMVEDARDLAAFDERLSEPNLPYEAVVKGLKRRGQT